ncbi:MAG: response regulator transcription factor, partial [Firmicutes bacterium]|nr:response regulator transcription factor [Bacillota bacterium]
STMPVLLLSVKSEEFDKVLGLSLGADDYMTKPFSPRELVARVKAILRRTGESNSQAKLQSSHILRYQNMAIDLRGYQVTVNNEQVPLSGKEFELLAFLALHPNEVFSREQIYDRVWGADAAGDSRTVMVHIRRLRERLAPYPEVADCIKTVWGIGYKFQLDS